MEFEIKKEYPPNIEELKKAFNLEEKDILEKGIVFPWGLILYNPAGLEIPPHLIIHEKVHQKYQLEMGAETWWKRYIEDQDFRLEQEIEAYRAQYQFIKGKAKTHNLPAKIIKDFLTSLALDLCSGMYGNMVEYGKAETLIRRVT